MYIYSRSSPPPKYINQPKHSTPYYSYLLTGGTRLRLQELQELQEDDPQARKIKAEKLNESWENSEGVELISGHHNGPLAGDFGIEKTRALIARK